MKCSLFSSVLSTGFVLAAVLPRATPMPPPARGLLSGMPEPCDAAALFCTKKHDDYPQDIIDNLLKQYQVSLGPYFEPTSKRFSDDSETQEDCQKSGPDFSEIYEVVDGAGRVRVVVQGGGFTQQVRIERCLKSGRLQHTTRHITNEEQIKNHNITCEQNTMPYSFLVLDQLGSGFESLQLELPVYCACRLVLPA